MRHRLAKLVIGVLCCLGLALAVERVRSAAIAQASPPAAPPAQPAAATPAPPSAANPGASTHPAAVNAVGTAPGSAQSEPAPAEAARGALPGKTDGFDLIEALRGKGPAMSSDEAAKRAAQTAPSVAKVEAAAFKAEAAAAQANIAVYPRLELEARYTRVSDFQLPSELRMFGFINQLNQGLFQARLSWPVSSIFLTLLPRHKAAMLAAEAQRIQSRVERQTVALRTREAYYNYARARAARMVAVAALAQAEGHRRDSDALVNAGSIARVELMRADAQVAAAKVTVARADFSVQQARVAFNTLVHVDGVEDITVSEDLEADVPAPVEDENGLLKKALERRSEILAIRKLSESQQNSLKAVKGAYLPVIAIGGSAEEANPNQRIFGSFNEWRGTWAAQASLVWSPNDAFSANTQVDQAQADLAQTMADLGTLTDSLRVEVSQAYNGYASAHAQLDAARAGIAAAEESYRVRREQFRAGAAIAVDVLDAEAQLRQARLDLVNALIDTRIAKARVDRAVEVATY